MKKVTILSLHLGYGGIEKSIVALANLLCEKYKVEIACVYKLFDKPVFKIDDRVMINYLTDVVPNHEGIREAKKNKKVVKLIKEYRKSGSGIVYANILCRITVYYLYL